MPTENYYYMGTPLDGYSEWDIPNQMYEEGSQAVVKYFLTIGRSLCLKGYTFYPIIWVNVSIT